jgi:hypothetical protein
VAAVLGQTELLAVIGAEFDGHDVGCVGGVLKARKKPDRGWPGLMRGIGCCLSSRLRLTAQNVVVVCCPLL